MDSNQKMSLGEFLDAKLKEVEAWPDWKKANNGLISTEYSNPIPWSPGEKMNKRISICVNVDEEDCKILQALESIDNNDDNKRNCADKIRLAIKDYIVSRVGDKNKIDAKLKKWKRKSDTRLRKLKIVP